MHVHVLPVLRQPAEENLVPRAETGEDVRTRSVARHCKMNFTTAYMTH